MEMQEQEQQQGREQGFTLIELLVAIVVVGILTAVAIVGIAGLTAKGGQSACKASQDAASAAASVFYANSPTNQWPTSFTDMINSTPQPDLTIPSDVTNNGSSLAAKNGSWTLSIAGGGATQPTFSGCDTTGGS